MTNKETLGARVRRLRRERTDLNQAELARAIHIDPATLNQIEQGKRKPSAETISRLAERLGVSRDYLIDGQDKPVPPEPPPRHDTAPTEESATSGEAARSPDSGFQAALQAEIYATLATVFAGLAADLEARSTTHVDRKAAPSRRPQRPARAQGG